MIVGKTDIGRVRPMNQDVLRVVSWVTIHAMRLFVTAWEEKQQEM